MRSLVEQRSNVGVLPGQRQVVQHRAAVESGAPDVEDLVTRAPDVRGGRARRSLKLRDRELFARFDEVEQVVAHVTAFGACRLRRREVHAAIDGHGVDGQDLYVIELFEGQGVRERRFARRRRSDQRHRDVAGTHKLRGMRTLWRGARTVDAYSPSR